MKKFFLLVLFNIYVISLTAQTWVRQYPFENHGTLSDIVINDNGKGWAVGEDGIILRTENGGELWLHQTSPQDNSSYTAVTIVPGTDGMVAFAGGNVLHKTSDGGQTWQELTKLISTILEIYAFDANNIIAIGLQGGMRSTDGGNSWIEFEVPNNRIGGSFFIDKMTGWVGSGGFNNNHVHFTDDGGATWQAINQVKYPVINDFHFLSKDLGFMASRDWIHKTSDGGITWDTINPTSLPSTTDLHAVNENEIWVGQNNGSYIFTQDGGATWISEHPNLISNNSVQGLYAMDDGRVWMAGKFTSIIYTNDRGTNWADQVSGQKNIVLNADFLNDDFGVAVGSGGLLLRTTNGGAVWEDLTFESNDISYLGVSVFDQNNVVVATNKRIIKSTDGGTSWVDKSTTDVNFLTNITAKSSNEIFITSQEGIISRTTDGGDTWNVVFDNNATGSLWDIKFPDANIGYAVGFNGVILKSDDGGLSWSKVYEDGSNKFENISIIDNQEGWISSSSLTDTVFHTADGGTTWEKVHLGVKTFWQGIAFMDKDTGWVAGGSSGNGIIYKTIDGGDTWKKDLSVSEQLRFITAPVMGSKTVWSGGVGGNIFKFSPCQTDPLISELQGDETPCIGENVFYEVNQTGIDIFEWSIPDDWVIQGNTNTSKLEVLVGNSGGQVTVKGSNSCGDETAILSVGVNPTLVNDVTISNTNGTLSTTASGVVEYAWLLNGEAISGATQSIFIPIHNGSYSLQVTYASGCVRVSNAITIQITSINNHKEKAFDFYPNPADNYIQFSTTPESSVTISIIDITGKVLNQTNIISGRLDVSSLNEGIYMVVVTSPEQIRSKKLIINR